MGFCLTTGIYSKEAAMQGKIAEQFKRTIDTTLVTEEGCTVERFRIYSPSMERDIQAVVVLPPAYQTDTTRKFPILYTLHGYGAPYDTWAQMPKLRAQLKDKPFIYTCFDGDNGSYYIDSRFPVKTSREKDDTITQTSLFKTFFFDEFVPAIDAWYRVDAAHRAATGFSMGGCGAMTYMLEKPGMFCAASGLSSAFFNFADAANAKTTGRLDHFLGPIDQNRAAYDVLDHYKTLKKYKNEGVKLPPLYQHIGTEDFLLEQNRKMKAYMDSLGIPVEYRETAGAHNWAFWHPAAEGVAEFHWKHFQNTGTGK
jgi:S-formylglutathione hydrolase FrmB